MERVKAVIRKEVLHILRDRRTLILITLMPMIQLIIYGYAVDTDIKHLSTVVLDEDRTPLSRRLIQSFVQSSYFDVHGYVESMADLRRYLDRGKAKAGLHIPPDFTKNLLSERSDQLQLLIDGTDSNPANTALNTSRAIVLAFVQQERLQPAQVLPIDFRPRLWYNPDLKTAFFMIPGLVGLLLQLLVPMITSTAIVREKERGNLEQLLVTPIKPYELVLGKIVPYVGIGMIIACLILFAARLLFQMPIRGDLILLMTMSFIFLTVCLGIGILASTLAENQQQAAQMVMLFAPPSVLLSGFIFPRETMPLPIFYLGYAIPLTYFLKIIRGITLKGLGLADLWPQVIPLLGMVAVLMWISIRRFQKRLA